LKVLRALASFDAAPLHVVPTLLVRLGLGQTAAAAVAFFEELIAKAHRRQLARFVGLDWQDNPALRAAAPALVETARALGIPLTFHDQAPVPSDGGRLAAGFGAATVSHLDCAGQEDVDALAASGTIATLAPTDAFHQAATAHAPARALIDAGVAVALGTNFNPLHTPTLSMQAAVALACSRFRFTPAEALTAATINSAHALRCADRVGSLECGKAADIVILETSDHRDLAHHFGYNLVARTIKGGRLIASQSPVDSGQAPPRTHSVDGDD